VDIKSKKFKKLFPNLANELEQRSMTIKINSVQHDENEEETTEPQTFRGYNPDVIDFLKRCDTVEDAQEIIDYMEKQNKISKQYAIQLRRQLKEKGVRSFGAKKEDNYYHLRGKL
jgi:hypothetical protein